MRELNPIHRQTVCVGKDRNTQRWAGGPPGKGHDTRALQAYLGHRNIQLTVRSLELSPAIFGAIRGVAKGSLSAPDYPSFFAERPLDLGAIHGPAVFGG
jgi:hypothetical protein